MTRFLLFFWFFNNWFDKRLSGHKSSSSHLSLLHPHCRFIYTSHTRTRTFFSNAKYVQRAIREECLLHVLDNGRIYHTRGLKSSRRREDFAFIAAYYNVRPFFIYTFFLCRPSSCFGVDWSFYMLFYTVQCGWERYGLEDYESDESKRNAKKNPKFMQKVMY